MKRQSGFTIIEILIVIAIVGVLAALAWPSYTAQTEKSRRQDARDALLNAAALQERQFMQNQQYNKDTSLVNIGGTTSKEGYYTLSLIAITGCAVADTHCYAIAAEATGPQVGDENCLVFTLDSYGRKKSYDGVGGTETDFCW